MDSVAAAAVDDILGTSPAERIESLEVALEAQKEYAVSLEEERDRIQEERDRVQEERNKVLEYVESLEARFGQSLNERDTLRAQRDAAIGKAEKLAKTIGYYEKFMKSRTPAPTVRPSPDVSPDISM